MIKGAARREMSVAFALRAVLLMTLVPTVDARAVMAGIGDAVRGRPDCRARQGHDACVGPAPM